MKNRRRDIDVDNNNVMLILITFFLLLFLSISIIKIVKADSNTHYDKSFISIEIHQGDTLSSLAQEYAISPSQYIDYIKEVKSINNLKSDKIHSGCYLIIPCYKN